ncbi:MAG: NTPase [Candidatus Tritonobacter lacicola]|nr:NTPase [Candidatus Tritonobacter lacicola]
MNNILLTGRPGVGKTTIIKKAIEGLEAVAGGFYTEEIREGGRRVGFRIRSMAGEEGVLAHVDFPGPCRVSKYGVNIADLERVGCGALEAAVEGAELIIMDEIGSMELYSVKFQEMVLRALSSSVPVLGTLQAKRNEFLDGIRERGDVEIVRVTEGNRNELARILRGRLLRLVQIIRPDG